MLKIEQMGNTFTVKLMNYQDNLPVSTTLKKGMIFLKMLPIKCSSNIIVAILWTLFSKISSCRFFQILREYENKLYTVKL